MNALLNVFTGVSLEARNIPVLFIKICVVAAITVVLRGVFWFLDMMLVKPLFDPLRLVPGPEGAVMQTHLRQVLDPSLSPRTHADWTTKFGKNFRIHGFGRHDYRLMALDFRSMVHVLSSPSFEKPWQTRTLLSRLIGRGIFSMEGSEHKMQRRLIAPAFSAQSIKNMAPIFFRKAEEVCERWKHVVRAEEVKSEESVSPPTHVPGTKIDVAPWMSRAAFDIVGLAGFNYDFHSVEDETEEVYSAYRKMFDIADKGINLRAILEFYFPVMRKLFVTDDIRVTNESLKTIARTGKKIVEERKAEFLAAQEHGMENKDVLTLLIKANLSTDPGKRLTDKELLDQCSTFLLAGSDSVSNGLCWSVFLLATHQDVQKRLRQEIRKMYTTTDGYHSDSSDDSGFQDNTPCHLHPAESSGWDQPCSCSKTRLDAIENLSYLDHVVREVLRFCPPIHSTIRVAVKDDKIPISHPVTLKNGQTIGEKGGQSYINIRKGSYVHIPIEGFNYSEDIWGPDAQEFRPDRWNDVLEWDPSKPGINNLMTFSYGPHSCLGHKWTISEIKIFLCTLLHSFEFHLVEGVSISKLNTIITRPYVKGEWSAGPQLPIVIREAK